MRYAIIISLVGLLLGCQDTGKLKEELLALEARFSTETTISDLKAAESFIAKTERFVKAAPADSLSPRFLFKSAGVAKTIGKFDVAYRLWDQLITQYPDNFWSPAAAFLKGFTAETELADREKAVKHFQEFLELYPDSELAGQAQRQIDLLQGNKSPEDLVKEFEQNLQDSTVVE